MWTNYRDAYGRIRKQKKADVCRLILVEPKKPTKSVYRRGYKDHGSLRTIGERARKTANELTSQHQYELELERNNWRLSSSIELMALKSLFLELSLGVD